MKLSIIFGGKAGQGSNFLGVLLGKTVVKLGYYAFYYRDYQSLIRGGHNYNALTFSDKPIYSNESKIDVLVALDDNSINIHEKNLKKDGYILKGKNKNTYFAGALFKILGIDFKILENELKKSKRFEENMKHAQEGYDSEKERFSVKEIKRTKTLEFINGAEGISKGAVESGLDVYYAYPMTPATSVLGALAKNQVEGNYIVLELENEISVINAAVGSAMTGAKVMVGTSGGGFDLMSETISLCGIAEIPVVIYLAQRPGPGTGVPTYSLQCDLDVARHVGHGEFPRIVLAPGDPNEAYQLASEAFYFSQKYKIPSIIISDKHLAESIYTMDTKPKLKKSTKTTSLKKYTSYEHTAKGFTTEDPMDTIEGFKRRLKTAKDISEEADKFEMFKIHGDEKSKNLILGWGSTKGAILDAINGLDCKFLQVLYIDPFSKEIKKHIEKSKNVFIIETNATSQLSGLVAEKTGFIIPDKNKILKYDARPFYVGELREEIQKRLK